MRGLRLYLRELRLYLLNLILFWRLKYVGKRK